MTRRGSARIGGYATLAAAALLAGLALRRPEIVILAAPFVLVLVAAIGLSREPGVDVSLSLATERAIEGEEVAAELVVASRTGVDRLELVLDLPDGVEALDEGDAVAMRLEAGGERVIPLVLRCARWGAYDVGAVEIRAIDPLRLVVWERRLDFPLLLRAYPRPEPMARVFSAFELQAFAGNEVARTAGDGIEYADLRNFVPGDRVRSINWRASARRQGLVVNERHPERNTDVVLFVDSFLDLALGDRSTLDDAVRAAASLATRYLERRDRVGLVGYGGILRWLRPGMGVGQRHRLIEALLETGVEPTFTARDMNLIPARILAPKALVIALTPLVDPRFVAALEDLRARRFDLAVVEVDPSALVARGSSRLDELAYRLWLLERDVLRSRLQGFGIGLARWGDDVSLDAALEGVRTYRRYVGRVRG